MASGEVKVSCEETNDDFVIMTTVESFSLEEELESYPPHNTTNLVLGTDKGGWDVSLVAVTKEEDACKLKMLWKGDKQRTFIRCQSVVDGVVKKQEVEVHDFSFHPGLCMPTPQIVWDVIDGVHVCAVGIAEGISADPQGKSFLLTLSKDGTWAFNLCTLGAAAFPLSLERVNEGKALLHLLVLNGEAQVGYTFDCNLVETGHFRSDDESGAVENDVPVNKEAESWVGEW
jgi:hypothetical protein